MLVSGNITPQSMAIASPPYSSTRQLRPISPRPPSGTTRSGPSAPPITSPRSGAAADVCGANRVVQRLVGIAIRVAPQAVKALR